jgi:hypothetical protein
MFGQNRVEAQKVQLYGQPREVSMLEWGRTRIIERSGIGSSSRVRLDLPMTSRGAVTTRSPASQYTIPGTLASRVAASEPCSRMSSTSSQIERSPSPITPTSMSAVRDPGSSVMW